MTKTLSPLEEQLLLRKLQRGDHHAFNALYDRYKIELGLRILRLVRSEELAEELLQDLFFKLWTNREKIDPTKSIKAYLYQTARNSVIDLLRRASRERYIHQQIISTTSELYDHIEHQIFEKENQAILYKAIDQLPPQRKRIYIHCKLEGKSYKEVADQYQISTSTVNDHIQKSTHFIRAYLTAQPGFQLSVLLSAFFY